MKEFIEGLIKPQDTVDCRQITEIASSYRSNKVDVVGYFNFPKEYHSAKGLHRAEFVRCIQESFLWQNVEGPSWEFGMDKWMKSL